MIKAIHKVAFAGLVLGLAMPGIALAQNADAAPKSNQFCANIADAAADARFSLQKQALADMEKEIESRIKVLEAKRAEYEEWLRRRNEVLEKADETVVSIYARMRPDAAALQLTNMDEEIAAAVSRGVTTRDFSFLDAQLQIRARPRGAALLSRRSDILR